MSLEPEPAAGPPGQARVLVGDADPFTRQRTEALLRRAGYDCQSAATGAEVLRLLDHSEYDLVVVDQSLEEGRGVRVITALLRRAQHPPVLVTAMDLIGDSASSGWVGPQVRVLHKPYADRQLLAAVATGIAAGRARRVIRAPSPDGRLGVSRPRPKRRGLRGDGTWGV